MAIKLQQVRRVRRWMMILLLVVMIIVVFSLNVHRSYRTDNHPRLGNVANVDAELFSVLKYIVFPVSLVSHSIP